MGPGIDGSQTLPATSLTSDSDESPMTSVRTGPMDFGLRLYCGISVALVLVVPVGIILIPTNASSAMPRVNIVWIVLLILCVISRL